MSLDAMSIKRKNLTFDSSPEAKRSRISADDEQGEGVSSSSESIKATSKYPRNDPVFGQKHAFPGLEDENDDELLYGPPEDGLEYLRMVRSEARTLPSIFIAPKSVEGNREDLNGDKSNGEKHEVETSYEGCYANGVYVALPTTADGAVALQQSDNMEPDPQEVYYNLLRHRFLLLRSTLKCIPPAEAIAALDSQHPITFPDDSKRARFEWRLFVQNVDPQMVQIACMDPESVLRAIAVVTRLISDAAMSGEIARVTRLAAWAWGLLGRCREVGEMSSEEVADIRELGKRAVKILNKIREAEAQNCPTEAAGENGGGMMDEGGEDNVAAENSHDAQTGHQDEYSPPSVFPEEPNQLHVGKVAADSEPTTTTNGTLNEADELEAAKARLRARLASVYTESDVDAGNIEQETKDNGEAVEIRNETRAMLDMIISVVGEFYGQRDLLESRDLWEEGDGGW
ncbi:hypothetical protein LOZ12_000765 [Ophidiomyces ophidiicola]|nr:hypothetical protein LOZ62_003102 [Ophidiomyces ophidiicola]KAI2033020.1 hypothetical protein LOZ45_000880 [Ophidiomyces ophidiicola]KAI2056601.1 hypothetical protein LOZ38_000081 [Ophidiomyces ophidiicola]KAI2060431.1 hypothetical protein LOZ44_000053 [Ophidiomyces ophidiicola]KAI2081443.1 hypothetical protein LOZ37_001254 [Ophidiomyces ophidiicola]